MFSIFSKKAKQATMPYTTDLHSHILPGIDDGSQNVETSLSRPDATMGDYQNSDNSSRHRRNI